jgi:hypothetical protein
MATDDAPLPLDLTEDQVKKVMAFLEPCERRAERRLLIEILDCLRRIDDKLERIASDDRRHT